MMHELVMPFADTGLYVDSHDAFAKQTVARAMAAVIVAGRKFYGKVGKAQLFIDADLRPDAGIAGVFSRIFEPGVVAEFAGPGNGVEDPEALSRAYVEAAHISFDVGFAARNAA